MMRSSIIIFEDSDVTDLFPLTMTRPASELRCGILSLREKIMKSYEGAACALHTRDYLAATMRKRLPDIQVNTVHLTTALLINGRLLAPRGLSDLIPLEGEDMVYTSGEYIAAMRLSGSNLEHLSVAIREGRFLDTLIDEHNAHLPVTDVAIPLIRYPWDLVDHNRDEIDFDFTFLAKGGSIAGKVHPSVILEDRASIYIGKDAEIDPGAVLMTGKGPIYIDEGAHVMTGAVMEGPVSVGRGSSIKMQAKIYGGTSVGEVCKVGGEIEDSIILGYSNKQHEGFLGHAYVGEWVNMGAGTDNSDLKNTYSTVKVPVKGKRVDSGKLFVGLIMGDHTKTGIHTMFTTGTVVGPGCNVFGGDFPPQYIPPFSWGGSGGLVEHRFDTFIETAKRATKRRGRKFFKEEAQLYRRLYEMTAGERTP
jgi:UDP-N-acetylglucosamine diphosphorylase/glucosamine-1-phosphate N-acetyltransferase